ncbi:MAG: carboxypeptidase-like regulatory domain-containing protein, partial [Actinomycetota bacterium]|nr:carboxypeptidase-like regulatory domain-containing protein [Actinomycetota bacterium]
MAFAWFTAGASAEPPENDNFADAQVLEGFPTLKISGNSTDSTLEPGEPVQSPSTTTEKTVWYSWTAPAGGETAAIDLHSNDFDTFLSVYEEGDHEEGEELASLIPVGHDDDGGGETSSRYIFDPEPNTSYKIQVGGYDSESAGPFTIQVTEVGELQGTVTLPSGEPADGVCVNFFDATGDLQGNTWTTPDGTYSTSLPTGPYRVGFEACDADALDEFYDDAPTLDGATPVTVIAGENVDGIDAELSMGGSISGTITDHTQAPVEGVCVTAYDE